MHECTLAKKPQKTNLKQNNKSKTKTPKQLPTPKQRPSSQKPDRDIAEDEKITKWANTNCWLSLTNKKSVTAGNWKPLHDKQQHLLFSVCSLTWGLCQKTNF